MSTIRLYFDVDSMERAVIAGLRARGVDVWEIEVGSWERSRRWELEDRSWRKR